MQVACRVTQQIRSTAVLQPKTTSAHTTNTNRQINYYTLHQTANWVLSGWLFTNIIITIVYYATMKLTVETQNQITLASNISETEKIRNRNFGKK